MASERVEKTVFISYRRTNFPWAMAIYQYLVGCGYDVFLDYTGIGPGDFEQVILANIRGRAHFLALLTPSALDKCDEPGDWLRREIETALDCKRNIVPIFLEDFNFDSPNIARHLTGKMELLRHYNGFEVPMRFFQYAMKDLDEKRLSVPLDSVLHPMQRAATAGAQAENVAASAAAPVKQEELTAQQWFERGFNATDPDEQIRCYSEAIRLKPDYGDAFCNRGIARQAKDDLNGAIADYDEAIRLQPEDAINRNNRGSVRKAKGDLDGAIADYSEAIRLKPDYGDAFFNRGVARKAKDDFDGAIADYDEAIRLQPEDAINRNIRGSVRKAKGDLDGAIADYSEAIRLKPGFGEAFDNRGTARRAKGDLNGAIADYDEAIRLLPGHAISHNNRGVARHLKDDFDRAIADYSEAIRLKPDYALAYNNRALARKAKGDIASGRADEETAKRLGYKG